MDSTVLFADKEIDMSHHAANPKLAAIANADAHTSNAGLPTYSDLLAFVQQARTAGMLMSNASQGTPEFAREAARLLARVADPV